MDLTFSMPPCCFTPSALQGSCVSLSIKAAALDCFDSICKPNSEIITAVCLEWEGRKEPELKCVSTVWHFRPSALQLPAALVSELAVLCSLQCCSSAFLTQWEQRTPCHIAITPANKETMKKAWHLLSFSIKLTSKIIIPKVWALSLSEDQLRLLYYL